MSKNPHILSFNLLNLSMTMPTNRFRMKMLPIMMKEMKKMANQVFSFGLG